METMTARVTGLGGVFHMVKDPAATRKWYKDYLGLDGEYGPMLNWCDEKVENPYSLISHFATGSSWNSGSRSTRRKADFPDQAGMNLSARPLMQWRLPVGFGPSLKIWPRCPPQRAQWTSVRG